MERTTTDTTYDVESFRQSAKQRAHDRDMSLNEYLALQILLSCRVLKGELETRQEIMEDTEYVAQTAAVQEVYEGARLLAGEVA